MDKWIVQSARIIADACDRIIIECRLKENETKPVSKNGKIKWIRIAIWNYDNEEDLMTELSHLFPGFKVVKNIGYADKNRMILELLKNND